MEEVCNAFGEICAGHAWGQAPSEARPEQIRAEMEDLAYDLDASAFTRMVLAEFSFCDHYGQKGSVENCEEGCHYTGYLCHEVKNCASNRLPTSITQYAQALAWLLQDSEMDIEHIKSVIPVSCPTGFNGKIRFSPRRNGRSETTLFPFISRKRRSRSSSRDTENRAIISRMLWPWVQKSFRGSLLSLWKETTLSTRRSRKISIGRNIKSASASRFRDPGRAFM